MKSRKEFPGVQELFWLITNKLGGLDALNYERLKGNLKPTEMAVTILNKYIQSSPSESVARNIFSIKMLLGEEDCNTELLKGVEKAIRTRQETEKNNGNNKVSHQLSKLTLQALIQDSEQINQGISQSRGAGPS